MLTENGEFRRKTGGVHTAWYEKYNTKPYILRRKKEYEEEFL